MISTVVCIFTDVAGAGKNWKLAVTAINERDAREYMRHRGGGQLVHTMRRRGSHVIADCGATTDAAEWAIRQNNSIPEIFINDEF